MAFRKPGKPNNLRGDKWLDAGKWREARREARKTFHKLFPFLPKGEKPLSWERQSPGN